MDALIWFVLVSLQPYIQEAAALVTGFALLVLFVLMVVSFFENILES